MRHMLVVNWRNLVEVKEKEKSGMIPTFLALQTGGQGCHLLRWERFGEKQIWKEKSRVWKFYTHTRTRVCVCLGYL